METDRKAIESRVARVVRPLMAQREIPGMAVGVLVDGEPHVFSYGVASRQTRRPVDADTLFEVGSVSKTVTATLTAYAQALGKLSLSDTVGRHLPALRGTRFGDLPLLHLATHTFGGLPLQVPDGIRDDEQLFAYLRKWRPEHAPGTMRTYANPSIGILGVVAARSLGQGFAPLVEGRLFPAFGMRRSFLDVPDTHLADYAQGYTGDGAPVRMTPGVLGAEAYGVKTNAADLLRYVAAHMGLATLEPALRRAVAQTQTGHFRVGAMTQCLVWERYAHPVARETLLAGNAPRVIFEPTPVTRIRPAEPPRAKAWVNKTGSTNGFSAYVAFVPAQRRGIVLLANRSYPIDARVSAAHRILASIAVNPGRPKGTRDADPS